MKSGNQIHELCVSSPRGIARASPSFNSRAPGRADPRREDAQFFELGLQFVETRVVGGDGQRDQIAALVLAEEQRDRIAVLELVTVAPMPDAIAISASATARPPSERSCTAVDDARRGSARARNRRRAFHARGRPAAAGRRRGHGCRAYRPTGRDACPSRPARRPAGSSGPRAAKPMRAIFDQSAIRPTPPMVGVGRMPWPLVSL